MSESSRKQLARWHLILGKFSQPQFPNSLTPEQEQMAAALEPLYSRSYQGRGVRQDARLEKGSLDPSQLNVPRWLNEIRELFPRQTCERITSHALERYGLTELVSDPEILDSLTPSTELLSTILSLKGQLGNEVMGAVRRLITQVADDIRQRLEQPIRNALTGKLNRFQRSHLKHSSNFDAKSTIRRNLKHWDPQRKQLIVESPRFFSRVQRHLPWEVILCVDQSGSMVNSVIHAAVMAGILASLPLLRVKLVLFDTSIVDASEYASDPIEVLMGVQLGGGTDIGQAVRYCEQLVVQPRRTIFVLLSDFCEGADPRLLLSACHRLQEAGVKTLGLAALDETANPWYDEHIAGQLAAHGMEIAAITPNEFAHWLAGEIQG
ncbi:MAG: VWA domain-containing protein [Planctomycetaceae bacterium]|nr:VWA domain-containing protein [Planctomycetaceae bacterium]